MDEGYKKFLKKWNEYEKTHIKSIDTSVYYWFKTYALKVFLDYCDGENIKLEYEIKEDGITVDLTSEFFLLEELDTEMLHLLKIAAVTFIEVNKAGTVTISLWFRGWKWGRK